MFKKFINDLFQDHYRFTEKELENILVEIEKEFRKEYEEETESYVAELQEKLKQRNLYVSDLEKKYSKLLIDYEIINSKVTTRELEDQLILNESRKKVKNPLMNELFEE